MSAVSDPPEFVTETWDALGTTAVILLHRADAATAALARRVVGGEIAAIDRAASRFRVDSELSRVNRSHGRWVPISPLLWEAIALGLRAASVSGGAVDPTLGRELIDAGYDRDWRRLAPPAPDAAIQPPHRLPSPRVREAWRAVALARHPPAVCIPDGVALDLGATAKALVADRAARAVGRSHAGGVLVALGGDIATAGRPPAEGWAVHVTDDHRAGVHAPGQTIAIRSGAVATSSTCVRRWQHRGRPMHHILDPRSGQPVHSPWRTVSVTAASCAEANIASTAAIVLGDEGPAWLAEHALAARLVGHDGSVRVQGGWPR